MLIVRSAFFSMAYNRSVLSKIMRNRRLKFGFKRHVEKANFYLLNYKKANTKTALTFFYRLRTEAQKIISNLYGSLIPLAHSSIPTIKLETYLFFVPEIVRNPNIKRL